MRWIAFGIFLLLAFGCTQPETGNGGVGNGAPAAGNQASGGHLVIGPGQGTVVAQGGGNNATPVSQYSESPNAKLYIYFFNVGSGDTQGDAILIKKGDADILIDAGPTQKQQGLVDGLLEAGVDDFELVVSTNDDPEHTGGLKYVSERFKFGELWRPMEGSPEYTNYLNSLGAEKVTIVGDGDTKEINGMTLTVLNPIKGESRFFDVNNDGVVVRLEDRGLCVLFTGDILGSQQAVATKSGPCQIVQWPNHGMSEGLTEINWFMDQTTPEVIVISGSARDWTNSRQSLKQAAVLGSGPTAVRNITILENYLGKDVKITWDGMNYTAKVER